MNDNQSAYAVLPPLFSCPLLSQEGAVGWRWIMALECSPAAWLHRLWLGLLLTWISPRVETDPEGLELNNLVWENLVHQFQLFYCHYQNIFWKHFIMFTYTNSHTACWICNHIITPTKIIYSCPLKTWTGRQSTLLNKYSRRLLKAQSGVEKKRNESPFL